FVVPEIDWESGRELGIFQAFIDLRRKDKLYPYELDDYGSILVWFNENLARPTRFTNSKPPYDRRSSKAICWFKNTAQEHLEWAWQMVAMLRNHQVEVQLLKAKRVGYVVYEDAHQIVAEPFAKLGRAR